ncbi:MAG: BF3164 family lipoprotein [Bacteroidota bacterium]
MLEEREFPNGIKTDELKPNAISYLFQGPIKGNINNNIYVKVGMVVDYIDIIDLSTKTINGPRQDIQDFSISYNMGYQIPVFPSESTERYIDLYVGEDSFFVLFFGKSYAQISDLENLNRIFEFDFDGKILKQYQLDFPLNGFTVDEAERYIYGVTVDREPNLVRFEY